MALRYLTLLVLLCFAVYTDMTQTKIRNRLIILGLFIAFLMRIATEGLRGSFQYFINISIPVILLYLLFLLRVLGAGDIKLFSMIGAFITTRQLMHIIVTSFFVGAIAGLIMLIQKYLIQKNYDGKFLQIHFSPAIMIAFILNIGR